MFSHSLLHRRQSRSSQVFILFVYFFFCRWFFCFGILWQESQLLRGTLDRSICTNENVIYDLFVSGLGEN